MRCKISVGHAELNGNCLVRVSGNSGRSCAVITRKSENGAETSGAKHLSKSSFYWFWTCCRTSYIRFGDHQLNCLVNSCSDKANVKHHYHVKSLVPVAANTRTKTLGFHLPSWGCRPGGSRGFRERILWAGLVRESLQLQTWSICPSFLEQKML